MFQRQHRHRTDGTVPFHSSWRSYSNRSTSTSPSGRIPPSSLPSASTPPTGGYLTHSGGQLPPLLTVKLITSPPPPTRLWCFKGKRVRVGGRREMMGHRVQFSSKIFYSKTCRETCRWVTGRQGHTET